MYKAIAIVVVSMLCGIFGMYSGSRGTPLWPRRYLIPTIIALCAIFTHGWVGVWTMSMIGVFSLGYGESSAVYLFWHETLQLGDYRTKIVTRATVGVLLGVAFLYLPLWFLVSLFAATTYVVFGVVVEDEPVIKTETRTYLIEDFIIYTLLTMFSLTVVYV